MDQNWLNDRKKSIAEKMEPQAQWLAIEWKELEDIKVAFNKVGEVLLKLLKKGQIDLVSLSKKIAGSILKNGCDGSSLPYELREEAKNERAIVIKLRNNKIKVFDFETESTLSIPIESTFYKKFKEFTTCITQQAAA